MTPEQNKRVYRKEMLLASAMFAAGLMISGLSLADIAAGQSRELAQATPPLQGTPAPVEKNSVPAEAKPGGVRPTTPAPEPAIPSAESQTQGAAPALPPAPAEKTGAPIQPK
jgi:hypothetical protein